MGASSSVHDIVVGHDITAKASMTAYDAVDGNALDTISDGVDLGICNDTGGTLLFGFGTAWMSFPAPANAIGDNNGVNQAFWIKYDDNTILVDNKPPTTPFENLLGGVVNFFGTVENLIIFAVIVAVILIALFVYFNFIKK